MFDRMQNIFMPMPMTTMPFMPLNPKLAEAYVPYQQSTAPSYSPEEALERGTMFVELYSPYDVRPYGGEMYDDGCR